MEGTTNEPGECLFAMVPQVTIKSVNDTVVTFAARSGSRSGDPNECLLRLFSVPAAEIYATPIAGAPDPVAMLPGATGPLYLSRDGWLATSQDGFPLYGTEQAVFKWPSCAATPTPPLTRLTVVPASIALHGHLEGETELFELELLGPDAAEAQDLAWTSAACIAVHLTDQGARRLRVAARATTVNVWPTRLVVHGAPAIDQAVSGRVDVLDSELAAPVQHIAFAKHGAPIALSLTQDGVNAFHVTPQAVAEQSTEAGRARAATPRSLPVQGRGDSDASGIRRRPQ